MNQGVMGFEKLIKQLQIAQNKINELTALFNDMSGVSEIQVHSRRMGSQESLPRIELLTKTEREVLRHISVHGSGNIKIAKAIGISKRTVEAHRQNMCKKLGLTSRELNTFATENKSN